jgi:peptidoglycan/xylan/chitin deacetylase (PgdA/CDA1 family)
VWAASCAPDPGCRDQCSCVVQSGGTRSAGPGTGWSRGWLRGGARSGPATNSRTSKSQNHVSYGSKLCTTVDPALDADTAAHAATDSAADRTTHATVHAPTNATTDPLTEPAERVDHARSRTSNDVALTFDMGGRAGDALAIVDWLVDHGIHASIFMTGAMAANRNTDAGRGVLRIIDAHPGQFTLGNHSYTHGDFRTLSDAEIRDELRRTEAAIAPFCGQDPRPFFRPPKGGYDAAPLAAVGAAGYRDTVTWDVDTIDRRPIANDPLVPRPTRSSPRSCREPRADRSS